MVEKKTLAKGKAGIIGNKGGMKISFMISDRLFNIYSCHLIHKLENNDERHKMMASLIQGMRNYRQEMDNDTLADFNFIVGDLNYRLESNFAELNNDTIDLVTDMLKDRE
mmetsp:Transcript_85576/g.118030  ORF Transcript_85576/g.118030 Transcript_85576/m.118030 type:complete len:110 (-) Transcript_85576:31-360(-)